MDSYGGMRAIREQLEYSDELSVELAQKSSTFVKSVVEVSSSLSVLV